MREIIVSKYIDYLILFVLFFTSRETVLFGTNQDGKMLMVGYLSPLLVLMLLILRKNIYCNSNYDNSSLNLFYILSICSLVTMVCNFDINIKYGYEILLYLLSYHIVNQIDFKKFVKIYCNIIHFIAIFAVITAIIYFVIPSLMDFCPIIDNKGNLQYYNLFFSVIPVENYLGANFRLYGIFREPGVAIIFFNLALIFELFVRDGKKLLRVLTLLLAIGLSFSTAGYIVCSLIFLLYLLYNNNQVNKGVFFLSIVFIGAIVFLIFSNDFIYMMVFYKFENSESTSTAARFGSITTNFDILIKSPIGFIWGLGYQYVEDAFEVLGRTIDEGLGHNTNTILKELSVHGAFFAMLIIVNIYQFVKNRILPNSFFSFILFAIVIIALGNEDLTADILLFLLVFYSQISENICLETQK